LNSRGGGVAFAAALMWTRLAAGAVWAAPARRRCVIVAVFDEVFEEPPQLTDATVDAGRRRRSLCGGPERPYDRRL
jgi:hypothetical protein